MALNFPATPEEGDLYTAEGVTYVWRTNRWVKVSDEELDPVEIIEANAPAGWQVWGDALIQWGTLTVVGTGATTLTFPKAFKALPALTMEHLSTNAQQFTTQINSMTAVAADVYVLDRNNAFVGTTVRWIAIGEAPDELKKPKVVHEGASGGDPVPVEIVEADAPAGWQVWGDTLIQWGQDAGGGAARTVTFPKAFKTVPKVSHTPISGSTIGAFLTAVVTDITTTGCRTAVLFDNGSGTQGIASEPGMWIAVGEAPDALKKPKVVQTIGGSELQEYHDPTGAASWRIVGTTLECWGKYTYPANNGATSHNFPKTFKREPAVTVTPDLFDGGLDDTMTVYHINPPTTTYLLVGLRRITGGGNPVPPNFNVIVRYHAIGEWDGVS